MSRSPDGATQTPEKAAHSLATRFREALARRVGIDPRALAALRVSFGAILLADLLLRARFLRAFYTDAGVLPRTLLRERYPTFARLSVHALSGEAWLQAALFVVAAVLALSLLVGYRTRTVTLLSWLLLVSLHARNPMVLNGGDSVLRRLVFWSVFLPLGSRWSVDAVRGRASRRTGSASSRYGPTSRRTGLVVGVATAALLVQVVLVYATNAVYKHRGPAWRDGTAILQVLHLDQFTLLLGDHLVQYPSLVRPLGELWLLLVTLSPLLLLLTGHLRGLLAAAFAWMHLGMLVTLQLGLFPLISIAGLLVFLPPAWWAVVETRVVIPIRERAAPPVPERVAGWVAFVRTAEPADPTLPDAARAWVSRLATVVVAALLVAVLVWNAMAVGLVATPDAVDESVPPSQFTWNMFAPYPPSTATWHVAPADLESGDRIDAFQRAPVRWHPEDPDRLYPSARWRKFLGDATAEGDEGLQREFARYLCARWNADHADRMERVRLVLVREPTTVDGPETRSRVELLTHRCGT